MITTAQMIDANYSPLGGLVNHVVDIHALLEKCREIASKITRNSPTAIGYAIAAVNAGDEGGLDGFEEEIHLFGEAFGTADFKEGTAAFLEKRKPDFKGKLMLTSKARTSHELIFSAKAPLPLFHRYIFS